MLRAFGHPVARCCEVLPLFGFCWLKFENGQNFNATFVDVAWCCSRLARFAQQCCTWACALDRFSTLNMSQHAAIGWPNMCNMLHSTVLRSVAFKCCDCLAGACKCWANNVSIIWPGLKIALLMNELKSNWSLIQLDFSSHNLNINLHVQQYLDLAMYKGMWLCPWKATCSLIGSWTKPPRSSAFRLG